MEALRTSSIKLILTRHEQAAAYGRLTGRSGVRLATLGPGVTNFVTSAAYAYLGGMPCLFITGQKPIKASKQGRFQIINVVSMMAPITKLIRQVVSADSIAALTREVFRTAVQEKVERCIWISCLRTLRRSHGGSIYLLNKEKTRPSSRCRNWSCMPDGSSSRPPTIRSNALALERLGRTYFIKRRCTNDGEKIFSGYYMEGEEK